MNTAEDIIKLIRNSKKKTPVRLYICGELSDIDMSPFEYYGDNKSGICFGEYNELYLLVEKNRESIKSFRFELDRLNSALPLEDYTRFKARIEPGAIIRSGVEIGDNAVIMMGAIINIGAKIGKGSMIDMNCVLGGRAEIGEFSHIGAGSVIAGVIEPPSASPVCIGDHVLIGANVVVLEGVKIGNNSVIGAGSVVTRNIPENSVAFGSPARIIKTIDSKTADKTKIVQELREL